jgi:hypothetical protein
LGSAVLAFLTDIENRGISAPMSNESAQNLEDAIEQEEARLRERLDKIAEFKRLARELSIPLSATELGAKPQPPETHSFDGTIASLIECYRTNERSPYHALTHKVSNNYAGALNRLSEEIGHTRIADINADRISHLYDGWAEGGRVALAHSFIAKLRLLSGFGATVLDDPECIRFASLMRTMRFKTPQARVEQMTAAHATAICAKAHEVGWRSIALAQAIQFELKLRSVDVIGEWVPISDPTPSTIVWGNEKWVRGLRWSDIDSKMILRFSIMDRLKRKKPFEVDLTKLPMVMHELDIMTDYDTSGPLIICEPTGRPYSTAEFRRKWRLVAGKAGVPDNVRNSDSIRAESKVQKGLIIDRVLAGI